MTITIQKTFRQWPENLIMPALARDRMSFFFYGAAESMLNQMFRDGKDMWPSLDKVIEWVVVESLIMWCGTKSTMYNAKVYRGVACQDLYEYALKVWGLS